MELTMVLVQLTIRATHGFIVRFTVIQALALPLAGLMVDNTVTPQTTVLVFTWTWKASVSHKTCGNKHTPTENYIFCLATNCDISLGFICCYRLDLISVVSVPSSLRESPLILDGVFLNSQSVSQIHKLCKSSFLQSTHSGSDLKKSVLFKPNITQNAMPRKTSPVLLSDNCMCRGKTAKMSYECKYSLIKLL